MTLSRKSRKNTPSKNPAAAGSQANLPKCSDISMDGMSKDQTDAAIMTPAEKPKRKFCKDGFGSFLISSTEIAPADVPMNGMSMPHITTQGVDKTNQPPSISY